MNLLKKLALLGTAASLFGLEYGNDDATWSVLLRVLRPRARVAFVLHKRGSHLDAVAADELVVARAAQAADGVIAAARDLLPTRAFTSLQTRAIKTLHLALEACGRLWIPETKDWRLNERH